MRASYLVDKSVLARMRRAPVRERVAPLIEQGEVATCAIIELEVLYSAKSHEDLVQTRRRRELAYEHVELQEATFERALDIQQTLAERGHHRVPIPDLVIAAAAERAGLAVLHYDRDFELISEATGQPVEWVVPRGSLDESG